MQSNDARHMVEVECPNERCKHTNYVDKRVVCPSGGVISRGSLDTVAVSCAQCGVEFETEIDCEGYK